MHDFPLGLLEWAGHRSGGVRRLFHSANGRPSGRLIRTALLDRLRDWAISTAGRKPLTPRIVLLVGGPGNGKTEAVESTIFELEAALGIEGGLEETLRPMFNPSDGSTVPRRAQVRLNEIPKCTSALTLVLVQDASVADPGFPMVSAAALLVQDLEMALEAGPNYVYLACVNRGVLDDALIHAIETRRAGLGVLESIVRAVAIRPSAPPCWPLTDFPEVAIWPMDVESLLVDRSSPGAIQSCGQQVLTVATDPDRWPGLGRCAAGEKCPYCQNRALLAASGAKTATIRILRWYELATGKRWSFRDLLSLTSFLMAGALPENSTEPLGPCERAARLLELDSRGTGSPESVRLAAPFSLLASQYQHALFGQWLRPGGGGIRAGLKELKIEDDRTLLGLHYFLSSKRSSSVPATLGSQLADLCEVLDPALADPELEVEITAGVTLRLRELDARFSSSVSEGLLYIRDFCFLTPLELDVLRRLAEADDALGQQSVRRLKPTTADRLQMLVRDFSCRLVRRSIGARAGVVRDFQTFADFERLVDGDQGLMHRAVKQVEGLLNERERFVVTLNTTFGEPLPPLSRRVVLTTAKQRVRSHTGENALRPISDTRFLDVGSGASTQSIPLTFDLFSSVRELQSGMLSASLPRTVVALLDTTRARLAGRIVRDEDQLDGAEIRIGAGTEVIVREVGKFLLKKEARQ